MLARAMPSILTAVRDLERLRQIVRVLVRHGFGELVQRTGWAAQLGVSRKADDPDTRPISLGERIRLVLTELGPSFVKLGQIVSTRPDLVPADIVEELKKLQDDVPPVDFAELRPLLERDLGAPLDELFDSLDEKPLASASIGQVHRARLRVPPERPGALFDQPGEPSLDVVLKIQRPNIKDTIERDIDLLYWMARGIERAVPESKLYSPVRLVGEFDRAITAELDFTLEADNAEKFARNFREFEQGAVHFPKVYRQVSGRRVLTLEYLEGKKVFEAVEAGADGESIARHALAIIIKQIFEDGFFHADPHPGNIIIQGPPEAPVIAMIDLGLVGRLTPQLRDKTVDLMVAAASEDYRAIADALYAIGTPTKKIDRREFEAEVTVLADKYLGKQLKDIELSGLVRDLVNGAVKYGLEVPSDFVLVGKALMTVEGIGKQIYPELDVFAEVQPYFLRLMWMRYSPEKLGHELIRGMSRLGGAAADMPLQVGEILEDLRRGDLTFNTQDKTMQGALDRLGRRVFSGLVVSVLLFSGSYLIAQKELVLGYGMLSIGALWAVSHSALVAWLGRKRRS
jgi:ubiquinone biosynthesis protein